ncbi:MAG: hypothetical protein DMG32_04220 [Acidobacteria bacterium]|nr:MAG: hypothetical protein DMG32_04220 [Acidobacteriota bacterium]
MRLHKAGLSVALLLALAGWLVSPKLAQTSGQPARGTEHTQAAGFSDAGKAALSRQLSDAVSRGDTPGVVALVVGREGVFYEGAAGKLDVAHNVAMPVNAIFSIASMTKPVTSAAIMMLFEEGKLQLDDPVSKYLTGFDNLRVITKFNDADATYETRLAKRPITIRHLLAVKQSRVPTQHSRVNGLLQEQPRTPIPSTPAPPFRGDGGLYSTVQDYGKFVQMMLNDGHLGSARILSENSVKMMGENNIGSIFVELQPDADKQRTKPFPLGAGHDKFGLGFQIASGDPQYAKYRSPGSLSWAGIYNTEFWIDPVKHIGGVQMMQVLPFYDDGAIRTLRDFEELVYENLR